jgi:hypothetical protein
MSDYAKGDRVRFLGVGRIVGPALVVCVPWGCVAAGGT